MYGLKASAPTGQKLQMIESRAMDQWIPLARITHVAKPHPSRLECVTRLGRRSVTDKRRSEIPVSRMAKPQSRYHWMLFLTSARQRRTATATLRKSGSAALIEVVRRQLLLGL
jgi:hypothetical protein